MPSWIKLRVPAFGRPAGTVLRVDRADQAAQLLNGGFADTATDPGGSPPAVPTPSPGGDMATDAELAAALAGLGAGAAAPTTDAAREQYIPARLSDAGLKAAYETRLTVNVRDYGAKGDGAADDTAAIQAAIAAVQNATGGGVVTFPSGTYRITATLTVSRGGVRLVGASINECMLQQATAGQHGIDVLRDTTNGETFTRGFAVENMKIAGPGGATTGIGVRAMDPGYGGQRLQLTNVVLTGWDICVRLQHWDNCIATMVGVEYSRVGYWADGNANSHKLVGIAGTHCTETAVRFGDGMGNEVAAQDIISCGRMLDLLDQSQVALSSYNFESCTGTAFVYVANGASLIANAGRFLLNVGADVPGFAVEGGGLLILSGIPAWSGFTTSQAILKVDLTAVVYGVGPTSWLSTAAGVLVDDAGAATYPPSPWPTRWDNATPGATPNLRNMLVAAMNRTTSFSLDRLYFYGQDNSDGANTARKWRLTLDLEGSGSPQGTVPAAPGTRYTNTDGGVGATLWVKQAGTGNTGWAAIA